MKPPEKRQPERLAVQTLQIPSGLLNTNEAAKLLGVCPKSVFNFVERGQLRAVKLGAAVRFDPADVAEFINRSKTASPRVDATTAAV
jgi:excisionase family DNA binding protein